MFNLILKDFYAQKLLMLLYLGIMAIYMFSGLNSSFIVAIISALFVMNSHYYDEKDKTNIFLNSLPFTRKEIVSSKYIGSLVFTTITILVFIGLKGISQIISQDSVELFNIELIILSYLLVMLFTSVYLPFFYKFTQQYLLVIFSAVFILVMFSIRYIYDFVMKNFSGVIDFFSSLSTGYLYILLTVITIIVFAISWFMSIKIYERKDF